MSRVRVRRVVPDEWAVLRDVRLRALLDAPSAFASTHAREVAFDEAGWRRRIEQGPWWLATSEGAAIGLVAALPEGGGWHLVGMWVEPAHRGTAVATELVGAVCARAADDGARVVHLWVADGNGRARRFYERVGSTGTGERQPLPSDPRIGEERMERRLRP